jgi:DNA-binding transcriptional regulator YdaS (Cro superfamily)
MGRPVELPGPLGVLARAVGGTAALGALVGVSARSLQRWAKTEPPRPARLLLERLAAEHKLSLFRPRGRRATARAARAPKGRPNGGEPKRLNTGPPLRLPGALGELVRAVGSTREFAELLGVSKSMVLTWAKVVPPGWALRLLPRLAAEYGLSKRAQTELAHFNEPQTHGRSRADRTDTDLANANVRTAR